MTNFFPFDCFMKELNLSCRSVAQLTCLGLTSLTATLADHKKGATINHALCFNLIYVCVNQQ